MTPRAEEPGPPAGEDRPSPADALRAAVDRTFQVTVGQAQLTRERAQDLVDDVVGAAARLRELMDAAEELRRLGERVDALERRLANLEAAPPAGAAAPEAPGTPRKSGRSTGGRTGTGEAKAAGTGRRSAAARPTAGTDPAPEGSPGRS